MNLDLKPRTRRMLHPISSNKVSQLELDGKSKASSRDTKGTDGRFLSVDD